MSKENLLNFTPRAQQALAFARKEADRFHHNFVGTEHLLLGLIKLGQGVAVNVLQRLGLDLANIRQKVENEVRSGGGDGKVSGNIPYTPRVKKILALAVQEANALNRSHVGTEHLLLGLLREGDGLAAKVLNNLDVDIEACRQEILKDLAGMTSVPHPVGSLAPFDQLPRTRIVFGLGVIERVGELALELGARRILVVTDRGIVAAGHLARAVAALHRAGLGVAVFDTVRENPTTVDVARCLEVAQHAQVDLIVGLGGGSSMDTAKGTNFLLTNGGEMKDYWGVGKATKPMLPLIAIPTTAGTGSECQSAALIADETTHQKMACLDPKAVARVALLDPGLTVSLPPRVTAVTGVDAIAHAVETAVSTKRNAVSLMYSHEAFKRLVHALPRVLANPRDLEARGQMLLGSAFAGTAIENSMLGAAHSAANPLTAHHNVVHGAAVGLLLPHVVRFNAAGDDGTKLAYAELASAPELAYVSEGLDQAVSALVARLERILNLAGIPRSLAEAGADPAGIPTLAAEAARQWTANFNPRKLSVGDFASLYESAIPPRGNGDAT